MIALTTSVIFLLGYCYVCYKMYQRRINSFVIVDFDSVLVSIEHIIRRGQIYVQNHPDKKLGEYVGAHITEQEINPRGILKALKLQQQHYCLVLVSARDESLRPETAKILNDWGIKGELYMSSTPSLSSLQNKQVVIQSHKNCGKKVVDIIDWSGDYYDLRKIFPEIISTAKGRY